MSVFFFILLKCSHLTSRNKRTQTKKKRMKNIWHVQASRKKGFLVNIFSFKKGFDGNAVISPRRKGLPTHSTKAAAAAAMINGYVRLWQNICCPQVGYLCRIFQFKSL